MTGSCLVSRTRCTNELVRATFEPGHHAFGITNNPAEDDGQGFTGTPCATPTRRDDGPQSTHLGVDNVAIDGVTHRLVNDNPANGAPLVDYTPKRLAHGAIAGRDSCLIFGDRSHKAFVIVKREVVTNPIPTADYAREVVLLVQKLPSKQLVSTRLACKPVGRLISNPVRILNQFDGVGIVRPQLNAKRGSLGLAPGNGFIQTRRSTTRDAQEPRQLTQPDQLRP